MDALFTDTAVLKEYYLANLYGNPHVASLAPDIHGIQFALSRLEGDHIGTLRVSFSVDFMGRNLFTRDRKIMKDYSLEPVEIPEFEPKTMKYEEKLMVAIHLLMDQVEVDWVRECSGKN
jgi:hypothetical protein